jgi:Holliday junction resolvasome RuvABC endonuclease subunit
MFLAIDPGMATLGWAIVDDNGAVHDLGAVITKPNAKKLGKHRDRRERMADQARHLDDIARRWRDYGLTIVAEEMSFKRGKLTQIVATALCWGELIMLARMHGGTVRAIPPKTWQAAILTPATAGALDYYKVFHELHRYVGEQCSEKLSAIAKSHRNHALDAVGVGVFAAMTPESAAVPRETKRRRA